MNRREVMKGGAAVSTVILAGVSLGSEKIKLEQFERMTVGLVQSSRQYVYGAPMWEPVLFQDIQPEDMIRKTSTPDPAIYQVDSISADGEVLNVSIVTSSYPNRRKPTDPKDAFRGFEEDVLAGFFSF